MAGHFMIVCDECDGAGGGTVGCDGYARCEKCDGEGVREVSAALEMTTAGDVYYFAERVAELAGNRRAFVRAVLAGGFTAEDFDPADLPRWCVFPVAA